MLYRFVPAKPFNFTHDADGPSPHQAKYRKGELYESGDRALRRHLETTKGLAEVRVLQED